MEESEKKGGRSSDGHTSDSSRSTWNWCRAESARVSQSLAGRVMNVEGYGGRDMSCTEWDT